MFAAVQRCTVCAADQVRMRICAQLLARTARGGRCSLSQYSKRTAPPTARTRRLLELGQLRDQPRQRRALLCAAQRQRRTDPASAPGPSAAAAAAAARPALV